MRQGVGNERIASALAGLLDSRNAWVRDTAVHSLDPLYHGWLAYGPEVTLFDPDWKPDKAHVAAVVRLLSGMTTDSNWQVRNAVASALSRAVEADPTHANAVMPLLLAMLDDPDRLVIPDVPDRLVILTSYLRSRAPRMPTLPSPEAPYRRC